MARPNTFIVGAPKCGTTALSEYLRHHPQVFFSDPKEPHYFCTDFGLAARAVASERDYAACFGRAGPEHRVVAEGSVWYLYSGVALRNIRQFDPAARIIVMLRNPVDMIPSLHGQLLVVLEEDIVDFGEAWRAQAERAAGRRIPAGCPEPRFLHYREVGLLGSQLERVYESFPGEQVLPVLFDDFKARTAEVYQGVLRFLELPSDGRTEFPTVNPGTRFHSEWVRRYLGPLLGRPPRWADRLSWRLKWSLGIRTFGIRPLLKGRLVSATRRTPPDAATLAEMREAFGGDMELLGRLIGRDLGAWLEPPAPA